MLNELLRNYLHYNLYEQAEKLAAKTTLPAALPNNQHARYFYYLGSFRRRFGVVPRRLAPGPR